MTTLMLLWHLYATPPQPLYFANPIYPVYLTEKPTPDYQHDPYWRGYRDGALKVWDAWCETLAEHVAGDVGMVAEEGCKRKLREKMKP